jgi:hypothetical protein
MAAGARHPSDTFRLTRNHVAGIALVSAVYFADIFFKASRKCYWFDELFTVYLCRLPSFKDTWAAVLHGADFNPPLFYLLTRGSQRLFGSGLIATRLPSTIGVWVFGLCLFLFVARRTSVICGFIAGVFPFFTLAQYYAYEARAHGISLGWCGLALLCWQRNAEGRAKYLWLAGFALSLFGALLTHVYALYLLVPFAIVEFYKLLKGGRPNWGIVAAMALAFISVTALIYLPLLRLYRGNLPVTFFPSSHYLLQSFLVDAIGPAIIVLLASLVPFAIEGMQRTQCSTVVANIPASEMLLALGFACIPLVGMIGCKVSHGPFLERYFLSSIAGFAIILGFATSRLRVRSGAVRALAGFMFFLMVADLGTVAYMSAKNRVVLAEPSSGLGLSTDPTKPMEHYESLSQDRSGLDIIVFGRMECLYFYEYASPAIVPHLYFGATTPDLFVMMYERLARGANLDLKTTTVVPFLATHQRFLAYSNPYGLKADALQAFATAGYRLKWVHDDGGGVMYEYAK